MEAPPKDDANPRTAEIRVYFDSGGTIAGAVGRFSITRPSAKHYHIEWRQSRGDDGSGDHAAEKVAQALDAIAGLGVAAPRVVEFFAGVNGALTGAYNAAGADVTLLDRRLGTGDSVRSMHRLLGEGRTFDAVDLDPYGYPTRFLPDVFLLLTDGVLLVTMPKPGANHGNHITWQMLRCYFGVTDPTLQVVLDSLWWCAMGHWREISLLGVLDFGRVWRVALRVRRVKATEFMGVRNRPDSPPMTPALVDPPVWDV